MALIACARMYNVTPAARQAWAALFAWLSETSGVALDVIDHAAPAPLEDLWQRPDLGCVFMCGWPLSKAEPQPRPIAAPVPAARRYSGRPVYFTDLVVRREAGYRNLEETFGGRLAWTVEGSHSGFNALRHHLLAFRSAARPRLYAESLGPAVTPARVLGWVIEGRADVAPLDSYALDLIRRHDPDRLARIAVVDSTAPAPMPPLVAASAVDAGSVSRLRGALLRAGGEAALAGVMRTLGLAGFAAVEAEDYGVTLEREQAALAAGYPRPG